MSVIDIGDLLITITSNNQCYLLGIVVDNDLTKNCFIMWCDHGCKLIELGSAIRNSLLIIKSTGAHNLYKCINCYRKYNN